jgi:hypothetical protein
VHLDGEHPTGYIYLHHGKENMLDPWEWVKEFGEYFIEMLS